MQAARQSWLRIAHLRRARVHAELEAARKRLPRRAERARGGAGHRVTRRTRADREPHPRHARRRARPLRRRALAARPIRSASCTRYRDPLDQELVALVAACIAFGNVKTIRAKLDDLLRAPRSCARARGRRRPAPCVARSRAGSTASSAATTSRASLVGARADPARARLARRRASRASCSTRPRATAARGARGPGATPSATPGGLRARRASGAVPPHLLPDPRGAERLQAPPALPPLDGPPRRRRRPRPLGRRRSRLLLVPVDIHIHRLARNLGFTRRARPLVEDHRGDHRAPSPRFDPARSRRATTSPSATWACSSAARRAATPGAARAAA